LLEVDIFSGTEEGNTMNEDIVKVHKDKNEFVQSTDTVWAHPNIDEETFIKLSQEEQKEYLEKMRFEMQSFMGSL